MVKGTKETFRRRESGTQFKKMEHIGMSCSRSCGHGGRYGGRGGFCGHRGRVGVKIGCLDDRYGVVHALRGRFG
jgi:hypothetical protein